MLPTTQGDVDGMSVDGINDVTKALSQLIESQIKLSVSAAKVTLLPPGDTLPEDVGVNLYLYRVVESPFARNDPWRGNGSRGPSDRPPLALQLHYLLTPLGKASEATAASGDVTHTMLGVAMVALHEHPVLNDVHIEGFDADAALSEHLRDSYEQVKVTLSAVGIEELSKIWATINKPYRLSVAYEVSLVELVPDRQPAAGAVVSRAEVAVATLGRPQLGTLSPATGALARLVGGAVTANQLTVTGSGLGVPGSAATVEVGGRPAALAGAPAPPFTSLTAVLPDDLDAGPQAGVRVEVGGLASEPLPFMVTPWLAGIGPVRTALDPAVAADATLTLTGQGIDTPFTVRFDGPAGSATAAGTVTADGTATAPIPATLANGSYQVRVVLADAAASLSNPRALQVVPRLDADPAVGAVGADKHRLDLSGARLDGAELRVVVDGVGHHAPANPSPTGLSITLGRLLAAGRHTVLVEVDGQRSRTVAFTVPG
jgi:hypothetical protein